MPALLHVHPGLPIRLRCGMAFLGYAAMLGLGGCMADFGTEFTGLSGSSAKQRLEETWPEDVDAEAVTSVDHRIEAGIDSSSTWSRITLTPAAAATWSDHAHAGEVAWSQELARMGDKAPEGIQRRIPGPPSLRSQTGTTPDWWSPPTIEFRATEVIVWYRGNDSGVARAVYTAFDDTKNTLWIYSYTCQHDLMWGRGQPPDGQQIVFNGE